MKNFYLNFTRKILSVLLMIALTTTVWAQERSVSGKVTDSEDGTGIPGVNVVEKGTSNGTITDISGDFRLTVANDATLIFSFVGYVTQEITVGNQTNIDVSMSSDIVELANVVVIGYGSVQKKDLTGSVASIKSEDFNKGVNASASDLLVGRVAGVQITTDGGAPGTGASIRIRGGSSLSASNSPLFVVDGLILSSDGISGLRNPLSMINPDDIESMTVLKDASATAIYGSRASNGVIIIQTKRGKKGQGLSVSYSGNVGASILPKTLDVLTGDEYRQIVADRVAAGDGNLPSNAVSLLGTENTDWQDEVFRTGWSTDHNISVSGDLMDIPYRASVGYLNQNGVLEKSNFQRTSLSIGLDPTFMQDHLKVTINARGTFAKNDFSNQGAIGNAVFFDPTRPIYSGNSNWGGYYYWPSASDPTLPITLATRNPVAALDLIDNTADVNGFIGNLELEYKLHFIPDLKAKLNLGTSNSETTGVNIESPDAPWTYDPINGNGTYNPYSSKNTNDLLEAYLTYSKNLTGMSSKVEIVGGYSWQHFWNSSSSSNLNYTQDVDLRQPVRDKSEVYLVSFFGRLNYSLKEKYLLTLTIRRDGSSRFVENHWGNFPSAAFAWRIKDEGFLANSTVISDLKLRLGYGQTGQENIGPSYPALARVTYSDDKASYQFGNTYVNTIRYEGFDANLKWETTETYNAGLDFGLIDNKLQGSIDYYKRNTTDLLNTIPVPIGTNFTNELLTNIGSLENEGFEAALDAVVVDNASLRWDLGMNLAYNENKITKLTAVEDPNYLGVLVGGISGGVGSTVQVHSVGSPANSFFVYEQVYDQNGNPVEGLYVDQNNDGIINDIDRLKYKNPRPKVSMGFSTSVSYNNLSLVMNARANFGNYNYNNVSSNAGIYQNLYYSQGYFNNVTSDITEANFSGAQYVSDYYVTDASFFRMDNMTLSYRLNNFLTDKINLNISLTGQNVFVITKYEGLDPEVNGGIDNNIYPRPRIILLGFNVQFNN